MIYIENKRRKLERIKTQYPNAEILDLTSNSCCRNGQILSPFFPHGNIPIPFSPNAYATCVESIWQGLKVFETSDIDLTVFHNTTMHNIKRTTKRYGKIIGHRKGINGMEILDYKSAKKLIYLPSYKWMLDNISEVSEVLKKIKERMQKHDIVFLDYNTNQNIEDDTKPLSHALLVKMYLEGMYPI